MEYCGYNIALEKAVTAYRIKYSGKGSLPKVLDGLFSNPTLAKIEIDAYLDKNKKKED